MFSPLIVTMNTINVSHLAPDGVDIGASPENGVLPPWPSIAGEHIVENTTLLFRDSKQGGREATDVDLAPNNPIATNASKRRSHFSKAEHRSKLMYKPHQVFELDFFNPILDLAKFKLKVPGVSFDIAKPLNGQVSASPWKLFFVLCRHFPI